MVAEVFFYAVVIYLIYKIVFDFIVPVAHAGRQMSRQFKDVKGHFSGQQNNPQGEPGQKNKTRPKSKKVVGDYIDFEEVKK
jgi:hypothetical protein